MAARKSSLAVIVLSIVFPLMVSIVPAAEPDSWHWRNPKPTGNPINRVAYGAGRFVLIDFLGAMFTSGDGRFLAVDDYGGVYSSTGGRAWTKAAMICAPTCDLAWGRGVYALVASYWGAVYTSSDGIVWTGKRLTVGGLNAVLFGGRSFHVAGVDGAILESERIKLAP